MLAVPSTEDKAVTSNLPEAIMGILILKMRYVSALSHDVHQK